MRIASRASLALVTLLGAMIGCSTPSNEGPAEHAESAIAAGTVDTTHTAVVGLLIDTGGGTYEACTGTVVQIKSGAGYVLTAAHCCGAVDQKAPSFVVMANDYSVGISAIQGAPVAPPVYSVTAGSVYYDPSFTDAAFTPDQDTCMLRFAAPAGAAAILLATSPDGVVAGAQAEIVGFGAIPANGNNSIRHHATITILDADAAALSSSAAGNDAGFCTGDSGGPVLMPAGAAQSAQRVVAHVSTGSSQNCGQGLDFDVRVASATGAGSFLGSYLADAPFGKHVLEDGGIESVTSDAGSDSGAPTLDGGSSSGSDGGSAAIDGGGSGGGGGVEAGDGSSDGADDGGGCSVNSRGRSTGALGAFLGVAFVWIASRRRRRRRR